MNKTLLMFVLVSFLSLGMVVSNSHAAGKMGKRGFMDFNSMDLIGASVKGSHGELIGVVNEVMVDTGGHAFAVINHGAPFPYFAFYIPRSTFCISHSEI
jgi:ribosomal 30S subunit maturation factor RimM